MNHDPIVDEVRQIRKKIEDEHGKDSASFLKYIMQRQERHKDRLVRFNPQPRETPDTKLNVGEQAKCPATD